MADKFLKASIYTIIGCILAVFLLTQPYNLICRITKKCYPISISSLLPTQKGSQKLKINFSAHVPEDLANELEFYPKEKQKIILNGKVITSPYIAKNLSNEEIIIMAKYSLYPQEASKYLDRIECLCFQNQILAAGELVNMPTKFRIDPDIEKDMKLKGLKELTINYEVFLL